VNKTTFFKYLIELIIGVTLIILLSIIFRQATKVFRFKPSSNANYLLAEFLSPTLLITRFTVKIYLRTLKTNHKKVEILLFCDLLYFFIFYPLE